MNIKTSQQEMPETEEIESEQHVTFSVGEEKFALAMHSLKEIVRLPAIIKVPLSPPGLEGLVNLRGQVLPIVNMRKVLGFEQHELADTARVLVINLGTPVGFLVDRVSQVIAVNPDQIEDGHTIEASVDSQYLHGVIKNSEHFDMLMLLDFHKVIEGELGSLARSSARLALQSQAVVKDKVKEEEAAEEMQLVSFAIDQQEYAIPIENVKEIVQIPDNIIHVPKAPQHVLGVVNLRQQLLPLISLRQLFQLDEQQTQVKDERIVVVSFEINAEKLYVGLVTDMVREVLRVPLKQIEEVPALLRRDKQLNEISSICRLDEGQRLVSILSMEKMFVHEMVVDAVNTVEQIKEELAMTDTAEESLEQEEQEQQLVVFRMLDEEYAVPIQSVKEIVRVPEQLTHVPKAPEFIEGIINLRGTVLPVVDERRRLGLPHMTENEKQRIMVFVIADVRTGFIVDSVTEVLRVPRSAIKEVPDLTEEESKLIPRVVNFEQQGRMIMLLDVEQLLESHEVHALTEVVSD